MDKAKTVIAVLFYFAKLKLDEQLCKTLPNLKNTWQTLNF